MEKRSHRQKKGRNKDAAAQAINYDVLKSFITAVNTVMTTTIARKMLPVAATPNTTTYSSAINPYNNESFRMKTKEGKY